MIASAAEAAREGSEVSLAIITLAGTITTGIIALIGTIVATRGRKINEVAAKLDQHLDEAKETRAAVADVQSALDDHVRWEMTQKYPQSWDGITDRRHGHAHGGPR